MEKVVSPVIDLALKQIESRLNRIKENDKEDIIAFREYLEIARIAIEGLGKEVQAILVQARVLIPEDSDSVNSLKARIYAYLYEDNLRVQLKSQALEGVIGMHPVFREKADRFFQLPAKKEARRAAVQRILDLVEELQNYLKELENDYFWQYQGDSEGDLPGGGSGMLMVDMKTILNILESEEEPRVKRAKLDEFLKDTESDRSLIYDHWRSLMGRFTAVQEEIRSRFR